MKPIPFQLWIHNQPDAETCPNCDDGTEECNYCDGLGCDECAELGYYDCETCQGYSWVIRKENGFTRAAIVVWNEQIRRERAILSKLTIPVNPPPVPDEKQRNKNNG